MSLVARVKTWFDGRRGRGDAARLAQVFAGAVPSRTAGWWRDDQVEQLRNYQSWVYAAVNAIAQDVAAIPFELASFCGGEEDSGLLEGSFDRLDDHLRAIQKGSDG